MRWRNALAIINPRAGRWGSERAVPRLLRKAFATHSNQVTIRTVGGSLDAQTWAEHAAQEGFDFLIVSGGDGTVHAAATGLLRSQTLPLAILPTGSGNLLAAELGIPRRIASAIELLETGSVRTIDIGNVTSHDRLLLAVGAVGYGSTIIADARQELKSFLGRPAYYVSALKHLIRIPRAHFSCRFDGTLAEIDAQMIVVANTDIETLSLRRLGATIAVDDGLLDVLVFSHKNFQEFAKVLSGIVLPGKKRTLQLQTFQAKDVAIEATPPLPLVLDGEQYESGPLHVRAAHRAIPILVPSH